MIFCTKYTIIILYYVSEIFTDPQGNELIVK